MNKKSTIHIGTLHAKPGYTEALIQSFEGLKQAPGYISHECYRDTEDSNKLTLVEKWENKKDHENFVNSLAKAVKIKTEIISNGHSIVSNNEDILIKGKIRKFWVRTDVTALYWDLVGEVSIVIEVSSPTQRTPVVLGPYSGKNIERTYINPSNEIATRVLVKSLEGAMHAMSSDGKLARVIRSKR